MRPGRSKEVFTVSVFGMQKTFPGVKIETSPKYNDLNMTSPPPLISNVIN